MTAVGHGSVPERRWRSVSIAVLASVLLSLAPTSARADEPPTATFHPAIGWTCLWWKASGELDGDGRPDRVWVHDSVPRRTGCGVEHLYTHPFFVEVRFGSGDVLVRHWTCAGVCSPSVADFDGDGRDELLLARDGGAAFAEADPYVASHEGLRAIRLRGSGVPTSRLGRGRRFALASASDSGTSEGFGCRRHGDARVLVTFLGRPMRRSDGRWRFTRIRLSLDGMTLHVLGVRTYRTATLGTVPSQETHQVIPRVGRC